VWAAAFPGNRKPLRRAARCDGLFPANLDHPDQLAAAVAATTALRGPASGPYDIAVGLPIGVYPAPMADSDLAASAGGDHQIRQVRNHW